MCLVYSPTAAVLKSVSVSSSCLCCPVPRLRSTNISLSSVAHAGCWVGWTLCLLMAAVVLVGVLQPKQIHDIRDFLQKARR